MDVQENINRKMETDPDGVSDEETDKLPEIQSELDKLNNASTEINRLENELDEARSKYRSIITETSARMETISRDKKKSIHRAREYYKLKEEAKVAQGEALKAARQYQTATGVYKAAKETVALAECRLIEETDTPTAHLDSAWQEMLSHAISKVNEAEREKTKSEQEHKIKATRYAELEGRILLLEKKYATSIKRSKGYFDLKTELDIKLMQQKHNVTDLQNAIKANKIKYSESFHTLEDISDAIHISRKNKIWSMFPRMPGVGSDTFSVSSGLSDLGLDQLESSTDITSKASEADTEYSDDEPDNNQSETSLSNSQAVSFVTSDKDSRTGSGSSLSTNIVSETSQIGSQDVVNTGDKQEYDVDKDNSDKKKENANKKQEELKNKGNHEGKIEINEVADETVFAEESSVQDTGVKNITEEGNENLRVNSMEENSDDVFEENYESCDEGEEPEHDKSENTIGHQTITKDIPVDRAEFTKSSSDINNVPIENIQKAAKQELAESKKDITKDETNEDKSLDVKSGNTAEITKNDTERIADDEYEVREQDMRNIERPSLSGSED